MRLEAATIRPGSVLEVLEDPAGSIRASSPGLFSAVDKENLPPIYPSPWTRANNSFSSVKEGDEVWIWNFSDNPQQLYWFRKDDIAKNDADLMKGENVEILCNREAGLGWAQLYFSDGTGWILCNDDSVIKINADGDIILSKNWVSRTISIGTDCISLGTEGKSAHPAVLGDKLLDALNSIAAMFDLIGKAANTNPYTMEIGTIISSALPNLKSQLPEVTSSNVTLD